MKDERLAELARQNNVAQFISFAPGLPPLSPRHWCIANLENVGSSQGPIAAIKAILESSSGSVNVRTFKPGPPQSTPFLYGIRSAEEALARVTDFASDGLYTIVNETIDTGDGGVSGVSSGGILEFAPDDTPRAVERAGVASLPHALGKDILTTVYGFAPEITPDLSHRVEFSIHPTRTGFKKTHTLFWESERVQSVPLEATLMWPNRFSELIGDKLFGLLIAHHLGLRVPTTIAIPRRVSPFAFGTATGTSEYWMRTCPARPTPGAYPTTQGWVDPYLVLDRLGRTAPEIMSVLAQEGVDAQFSGASFPGHINGEDLVEGVAGIGDMFMLGRRPPDNLPAEIIDDVRVATLELHPSLGPVRIEWVHDGTDLWVVQLHRAAESSIDQVVSAGEPDGGWITFKPSEGLQRLTECIDAARAKRAGIMLAEPVGLTSHVGDLLRKAHVPARYSHLE